MPVKPQPYKCKCEECGYTKVVSPKSDCVHPMDLVACICPTCKSNMVRIELNFFDKIVTKFKG